MTNDQPSLHDSRDGTALLLGPLAAIAVAGGLVPLRSWLGSANVALLLVVVVVGTAAVSDRRAGAATAVMSALAYNFFHTRPYGTLRVTDRVDLITVVLVLVVGLVTGELTVLRRRAATTAERRAADQAAWRELLAVAAGEPGELVARATDLVRAELQLATCVFEEAGAESGPLLLLERNGHVDVNHHRYAEGGFELPDQGVQVPVIAAGRRLGRLVLHPTPGRPLSLSQRRDAVAAADLLAVGLLAARAASRPS